MWQGLPLKNGMKFKFKYGRDVGSAMRETSQSGEGLPQRWGRLVAVRAAIGSPELYHRRRDRMDTSKQGAQIFCHFYGGTNN